VIAVLLALMARHRVGLLELVGAVLLVVALWVGVVWWAGMIAAAVCAFAKSAELDLRPVSDEASR